MPFDPYFSSAPDRDREKKFARVAYAKAVQAHIIIGNIGKKRHWKAMKKVAESKQDMLRRYTYMKGGGQALGPVQGGPSLSGFRQPKRKWDKDKR
jgi:hypothetical protein